MSISKSGSRKYSNRVSPDNASGDSYDGPSSKKRRGDSSFYINDVRKFSGSFPNFREPMLFGCFSLDGNRQFHDDRHQMKYFVMPKNPDSVSFDLNIGIKDAIRKDFALTEKIDNLLKWIMLHKNRFKARNAADDGKGGDDLNTDFICFRGLLTEILCTVYEHRDPWIICATKFRGTIYLCAFDTEEDKQRNANRTERDIVMSSWGYKFEQYMVADTEGGSPNTDAPLNEKEEFCCLVRTRLNSHSLVYGAEMDGFDPEYAHKHKNSSSSMASYIELKTSRIITSQRQERNFCRYKLLKWWAQSFLIGIRRLICGFRNDDGIVQELKVYDVLSMPEMNMNFWSPSICMNFCDQFLSHIKHCVTQDDPYTVYKFEMVPKQEIRCQVLRNDPEFQILPEWYISSFKT